jgi:hypothetical protein
MRKLILTAAAFAGFALPQAAQACSGDLIEEYYTEISGRDVVSASGARLTSVAAILMQDRANMHRFGRSDQADGYDDNFVSAASRALIPRWLQPVAPNLAAAILRGQAYIKVEVYEGCMTVTLP